MAKAAATASDLLGAGKLGISAAIGITDLVEQMHLTISRRPLPLGPAIEGPAGGVAGFVYEGVRRAFRSLEPGFDLILKALGASENVERSPKRDIALAALNGVVGDRLAAAGNPLAIGMQLRKEGRALTVDRGALAAAVPNASGRVVVLVHGLCFSDLQWTRKGHDHGSALQSDLGCTSVYLYYNSGRHISENGTAFAEVLETLVREWPVPVESLAIVGHSMGGLVARSACRYGDLAGHAWRGALRKLVFLGTPHHGAPLERIGSWVDLAIGAVPYTAAFNRLGRVRSAGITDLRYGNLVDEDWQDRDRFSREGDSRGPTPLPENVICYAIAGTTAKTAGGIADDTLGDTLVPVRSALGIHRDSSLTLNIPQERQRVVSDTNHFDLLSSLEVCDSIRTWLGG